MTSREALKIQYIRAITAFSELDYEEDDELSKADQRKLVTASNKVIKQLENKVALYSKDNNAA